MTQHTPGPWKVHGYHILGEDLCAVAEVYTAEDIPTEDANARLIAAAPQLLCALETLLQAFECGDYYNDVITDLAKEAIAKAKGEPTE